MHEIVKTVTEPYLGPCQTPMSEHFVEITNSFQSLPKYCKTILSSED